MIFAEQLKKLPGVSHLSAIRLLDGQDGEVALIENKPGSAASVAVYNHLAQIYGLITQEAAQKGLEIYAEHVEDARLHPGKHPNIDRLLQIQSGAPALRIKHLFAV